MVSTFRLISVTDTIQDDQGERASARTVVFTQEGNRTANENWTTVLIGKNGVGKSRLLAGAAELLSAAALPEHRVRRSTTSVSSVKYRTDSATYSLHVGTKGGLRAKRNGRWCKSSELELPAKIIALTTSPFDKFRVPSSMMYSSRDEPEDNIYAYLGLRDRTSRASPTAAIFRAIEGLFEASQSDFDRRLRIADVFAYLGYKPNVEVQYEIVPRGQAQIDALISGAIPAPAAETSPYRMDKLHRLVQRQPKILPRLVEVAKRAKKRAGQSRAFSLRADFKDASKDHVFFREVQLLRKVEIVRMRAAILERASDGAPRDLKQASSGELGVIAHKGLDDATQSAPQ